MRADLQPLAAQRHRALAVGAHRKAQRVQGDLQFGRGAHEHGVHRLHDVIVAEPVLDDGGFLQRCESNWLLAVSNNYMKPYAYRAQIGLLQPALVVGPSRLLLEVVVDPVVEAAHRAVAQLRQEHMLERRAADLAAAARVQAKPDGLQQLAMRARIGSDFGLLLQKLHGVPHQRMGEQRIDELVLLGALHGGDVLIDAGVLLVVVVQQPHFGDGRIGVEGGLVDGDEAAVMYMFFLYSNDAELLKIIECNNIYY